MNRNDPLEAHHLYSQTAYPDKRFDVNNGVLFCRSIHREFHRLYGPDTIPEQFEQFVKDHYNISSFPWRTDEFQKQTTNIQY